jgi:lipoprotein-anchoring transpeptidase ErfK/SrfK
MFRRTLLLPVIASGLFISIFACTGTLGATISKEDLVEAELRLSQLGYWILKVDGRVDASTRQAIIAFQKVERLKRTGVLTAGLMENIRFAQRPTARFLNSSPHIEIDITRQVLFLTDAENVVTKILPVSSGNESKYLEDGLWQIAHTPRGSFRITRKIKGVRKAPLGDLYYPNYFTGGVAIHGSNSVPVKPASHGCVRIPRFADRAFSSMVWVGMAVYVYD